eukprot:s135_g10.t1
MKYAPGGLRAALRTSSSMIGANYQILKKAIKDYLQSGVEFDGRGLGTEAAKRADSRVQTVFCCPNRGDATSRRNEPMSFGVAASNKLGPVVMALKDGHYQLGVLKRGEKRREKIEEVLVDADEAAAGGVRLMMDMTPMARTHAWTLFIVLTQSVEGRALSVIMNAEQSNGLQAWSLMVDAYEPRVGERWTAMLMNIISQSCGHVKEAEFL